MDGLSDKKIGEVFYETRVLMGRDYTLRRFAEEVLAGAVDPVMLGYIEKGQRFPSETLVRRLARVRKQDAHELLGLLWRERMVHAFSKELKKVLETPRDLPEVEDVEVAALVSRAIAALPDDGDWITVRRWRRAIRQSADRRSRDPEVDPAHLARVEQILREQELVEMRSGKVRRRGRHYVARTPEEQRSLALQYCGLFAKSLIEAISFRDTAQTHLRNHYLNIDPERLPEFRERLEKVLRELAEEFAEDPSRRTRFLNILVAATPTGEPS